MLYYIYSHNFYIFYNFSFPKKFYYYWIDAFDFSKKVLPPFILLVVVEGLVEGWLVKKFCLRTPELQVVLISVLYNLEIS